MNYLKKSKRGFSVIGSLLGFSLLGLSTIGLATYMGSFEQVKVTYSNQSNINFMHNELLGAMGKIITLTKMEVTGSNAFVRRSKKQFGLCQAVVNNTDGIKYSDVKDKAICPIFLKSSSVLGGSSSYNRDDRWKYFIQQGKTWEDVSTTTDCDSGKNGFVGGFSTGEFKKCVKYVGNTQTEGIFARLTMEPQQLPSFKKIQSSSGKIPIDELVFKLQSVLSFPRRLDTGETVYSVSKSEKYLWSTEALDCHVCDGNNNNSECKLARFSTSAQGTAARHSGICYHSAYKIKEKNDALEIKVEKIPPKFKKENSRIIAETARENYSAVCRSNFFRCGLSNKDDFDPVLKFQFLLNYDQPQDSFIDTFDLQVKGVGVTNINDHRSLLVPADQQARVSRETNNGKKLNSFGETWPLRAGSNQVTAFLADREGEEGDSESVCQDVCSQTSPVYYPKVEVSYGGSDCYNSDSCKETASFNNRKIACFQCNMKSCHRKGVGTHTTNARSSTSPSEPLDGIVPECAVEGSIDITAPDTTAVSSASDMDNKCLKTTSSGLQAVACGNSDDGKVWKPGENQSACFLDGETQILKGGSQGLSAQNNCLQVLSEKQLVGSSDEEGNWREGVLPSLSVAYNLGIDVTGYNCDGNSGCDVTDFLENSRKMNLGGKKKDGYYTFDNYARFSAFLGDHKDDNLSGKTDVFVPIQRDAGGMFHSGWMSINYDPDDSEDFRQAYFHREPFNSISFHDADNIITPNNNDTNKDQNELPKKVTRKEFLGRVRTSRPTYIGVDTKFHPSHPGDKEEAHLGNASDWRLVLTHHWAYKGIRHINKNAENFYPYLCRNLKATAYKDAFTTTSAKGPTMESGYGHCHALNPTVTDTDSDGDLFDEYSEYWVFAPPDSRKLWAAALQAVAPNAPRYPFPNPFKFADGIPFWKAVAGGKRQWVLSYNYNDMAKDDYLMSRGRDNIMAFTKEQLAAPSTAWIGGLTPIFKRDSHGRFEKKGEGAKSWTWKPDWIRILTAGGSSLPPQADKEASATTLLFEMGSTLSASADSLLTQLDNDSGTADIGVLNEKGRPLNTLALRAPNALPEFEDNVVKLCRYSQNMNQLDFHRALMILGKDGSWPSGGDCSSFSASSSESALHTSGIKSSYFKLPASTPEISKLKDLTSTDFPEINKGLRTIIPLLAYYHAGAMHVQNTDKFCRFWKREKKRRAVGRCIIQNYNAGTLSVAVNGDPAENHGLSVTRGDRIASVCHPAGKNCSKASNHFQNQMTALQNAKNAAEAAEVAARAAKTAAKGRRDGASSNITADRSACAQTCNQPCTPRSCPVPGETIDGTFYRVFAGDPCRKKAMGGVVSGGDCIACRSAGARTPPCQLINQLVEGVLVSVPMDSSTPPKSWPENCSPGNPPPDCSARTACNTAKSAACTRKDNYDTHEGTRVAQAAEETRQRGIKERLQREIACATPKLNAAKRENICRDNLANVDSHTTSYSPDVVSCSSHFTALPINFDDSSLPSTCWSLEMLNPQHTVTNFDDGVTNNLSGTIGVLGDNSNNTNWDKDAVCNIDGNGNRLASTPSTKLYSIPVQCGGYYKDINLNDDDLCDDDDGINATSCNSTNGPSNP